MRLDRELTPVELDAFAAELDAWVVLKDNLESYKSLIKWTPPKGDDGKE